MIKDSRQSPISEFEKDLEALRAPELHKKYVSEYQTHYRMLKRSRENGFSIDPSWRQFSGYLRDVGPRPSSRHVGGFFDRNLKVFGPANFGWLSLSMLATQRAGATCIDLEDGPTTVGAVADQLGVSKDAVRYAWKVGSLPDLIDRANARRSPPKLSWTYPGPKSEGTFLVSFSWWKKQARASGSFAFPDVYYYLSGLETLAILEEKLGVAGLTNFSDEQQIVDWAGKLLVPPNPVIFTRYVNLRRNLSRTLRYISARDPEFSRVIAPEPPFRRAKDIARLLKHPNPAALSIWAN